MNNLPHAPHGANDRYQKRRDEILAALKCCELADLKMGLLELAKYMNDWPLQLQADAMCHWAREHERFGWIVEHAPATAAETIQDVIRHIAQHRRPAA